MSELNARIAMWRDTLAFRLSNADLDELEDHLRQTVDALSDVPLSLDERFVLATHRLGAPTAIAKEFEKGDPSRVWRSRVLWMLVGSVGFGLFGRLVECAAHGLALVVLRLEASPHAAALAAFSFQVAAWLLIAGELVALTRGNGRAARAFAARFTRLPISLKTTLAAAATVVLFGLPGGLMKALTYSTIPRAEFWVPFEISRLAVNVIIATGLVVALALAAHQRRLVVPALDSASSR